MADPTEDITTRPSLYWPRGGKAVRIRPFWSTWWFRKDNKAVLIQSLRLIANANAVLKKYTLALDHAELPAEALLSVDYGGTPKGHPAVLGYPFKIPLPTSGRLLPSMKGYLKEIYDLAKPAARDDDRLIVVFMPLSGPSGYCVHEQEWLPWVVVDPSQDMEPHSNLLLHEIGHACNLGHQQMDIPAYKTQQEAEEAKKIYRNVMGYGKFQDQLWNWQVDSIYNSYWCAGPRPRNWWVFDPMKICRGGGEDCAVIWDPS
jgi:hypothetical protein